MADNDPSLFKHSDQNGDELDVWNQGGFLLFHNTRHYNGELISVRVDRCDVIRLHTALGAWISGDNVPVCDADTLYGQLIRQAVHEELARVIPECLAQTQAPQPSCQHCQDDGYECRPGETDPEPLLFRCRRCGASPNGAHENCAGDERACVYIRPGDAGYDLLADPEPHDVGHPTYEDTRPLVRVGPSHCGECTHPMNDHIAFGGCWGNAGTCACEVQQDAPVPVVESDKVWGEAGQPPVHCTCEHDRQMHGRFGCRILGCACRWKRGTS